MLGSGAEITITSTLFTDNQTEFAGGGIFSQDCDVTIDSCTFTSNSSQYGGGLCLAANDTVEVFNALFVQNDAGLAGGAIETSENTLVDIRGCTFHANTSPLGAVLDAGNDTPTITGSIIWENPPGPFHFAVLSDPIPVIYSNVEGGYPGEGNIDADPLFVAAGAGDFHLQESSPCIDNGDPDAGLETDIEGNPRDDQPDMGAYEYQGG
jgi:predicted outer membrane repeat protein